MLDDASFRNYFAGTPVRRAGYDRFMRNILIAAGNSDDAALVPLVRTYLDYQAAVVRAMAVWALSQLMDQQAWTTLKHNYLLITTETDDNVGDEQNGKANSISRCVEFFECDALVKAARTLTRIWL